MQRTVKVTAASALIVSLALTGMSTPVLATPADTAATTAAITAKSTKPSRALARVATTQSSSTGASYSTWATPECASTAPATTTKARLTIACDRGKLSTQLVNVQTGKSSSKQTVKLPTSWQVGGVLNATDGYIYVLLGKYNYKEKSSQKVYEVRKYTRKLGLVAKTSIAAGKISYGVQIPFGAGSPALSLTGSTLRIYLGRKMFKANDGLNHQKNLALILDTKNMRGFKEEAAYPWASHSFNQLIYSDDQQVVRVDHGDAYPRAIQLHHTDLSLISDNYDPDTYLTTNALKIPGKVGNNYTGTTVNGMAVQKNNALLVGVSKPHKNKVKGVTGSKYSLADNVYLTVTDLNTGKTKFKWLTTLHPKKTKTVVGQPRITPLPNGNSIVLYTAKAKNKKTKLIYTLVDSNGKILKKKSFNSFPTTASTHPIVVGNQLVWFDGSQFKWASKKYTTPWYLYSLNISNPKNPKLGKLRS